MEELSAYDLPAVLKTIRRQGVHQEIRFTQHAHEEMVQESITFEEVLEAIQKAEILENYPEHRRGPCCLILGFTYRHRPLHIVCTTAREVLIIITVYEPVPPKWRTPSQRG